MHIHEQLTGSQFLRTQCHNAARVTRGVFWALRPDRRSTPLSTESHPDQMQLSTIPTRTEETDGTPTVPRTRRHHLPLAPRDNRAKPDAHSGRPPRETGSASGRPTQPSGHSRNTPPRKSVRFWSPSIPRTGSRNSIMSSIRTALAQSSPHRRSSLPTMRQCSRLSEAIARRFVRSSLWGPRGGPLWPRRRPLPEHSTRSPSR